MEGLGAGGDEQVDGDQQKRRDHRRPARPLAGILGLLVDRHARVPAPIQEQAEQHRHDQVLEVHVEGVEPGDLRMNRVRRVAGVDLDQRGYREHREDHHLEAQQQLLDARGELDAAIADPAHQHDPEHRSHERGALVGFGPVPAEELEGVDRGDVGERGHHEQVGEEDRPAVEPAGGGPEGAGGPGERGAGVGVGAVEVFVGRGDQQHRDERHQQHRRGVDADALVEHDEAQRGRERVRGRGRGDPDHDVRQVADRVFLQPLVDHALPLGGSRCGCADGGHLLLLSGLWQKLRRLPAAGKGRDPQNVWPLLYMSYNGCNASLAA